MDIPTSAEIIAAIERFCERHGMAETRFGRDSTSDPNLLSDLRAGRAPKLDRLHRIADFMLARDQEAGFEHVAEATGDIAAPSSGTIDDLSAARVAA